MTLVELLQTLDDGIEPICYSSFTKCVKSVSTFVQLPLGAGSMSLLIGASGTGKSTIFKAVRDSYAKKFEVPGARPLIHLSARPSQNAYFSSKWMAKKLLNALHDPFHALPGAIAHWEISDDLKNRLQIATSYLGRVKESEGEMLDAFVSLAKTLQTKIILIDEANMMCLTHRNRVPTDYLESLRTVAQEIGAQVALFGSCELLHMLDYSAQMNRRFFTVEGGRVEDGEEWSNFLSLMEERLEIEDKLLVKNKSMLSDATYFIPGELVHLIRAAALQAILMEDTSIQKKHLTAALPTESALELIRVEADWISSALKTYAHAGKKLPPKPDTLAQSIESRKSRQKNAKKAARVAVRRQVGEKAEC